jgi:hypothetical protein
LVTPWRQGLNPSQVISGDAAVAAGLYSWAAPQNDTPERAQPLSADNNIVARARTIHGTVTAGRSRTEVRPRSHTRHEQSLDFTST